MARLGHCPSCTRAETVQIMSRGYYYGYHEWSDGLLEGRCTWCGYHRSVTVGIGKSFDYAMTRLQERWRDKDDRKRDQEDPNG